MPLVLAGSKQPWSLHSLSYDANRSTSSFLRHLSADSWHGPLILIVKYFSKGKWCPLQSHLVSRSLTCGIQNQNVINLSQEIAWKCPNRQLHLAPMARKTARAHQVLKTKKIKSEDWTLPTVFRSTPDCILDAKGADAQLMRARWITDRATGGISWARISFAPFQVIESGGWGDGKLKELIATMGFLIGVGSEVYSRT